MSGQEQPINFYEEYLEQAQARLYAYILALVANPADAKDVLQESNQVILAKIGELKQADRFNAWSYKIAYYQSLAFLKRRKRQQHRFSENLVLLLSELAEEQDSQNELQLSRVEKCLGRLQDRSKAIVRDYYFSNLPLKKIARNRKVAPNHIAQILFRARQALHECITRLEKDDHE